MLKGIKFSAFYFAIIVGFIVCGAARVSAYTLNQQDNFFVNSKFDKYSRKSLDATLVYIGNRAYYYVDNSYWNKLDGTNQSALKTNIVSLADTFDNDFYTKSTSFWGSEPNPGVDNDPKLTILLEELIDNNGGYFDTANGYTKEQITDSNGREMIALNVGVLSTDVFLSKMFFIHEFQHLISFNQKEKAYGISEDVWLNELRSEYAISQVGMNVPYLNSSLNRRTYMFSTNPPDSLTEWPNKNLDYAVVALFGEYLAEQFGESILADTLKGPLTGISSINKYLQVKKPGISFSDVYLNWLGALYLNDVSKDSRFGYSRAELRTLRITPQQRVSLTSSLQEYSATQNLKDWQPYWLEYDLSSLNDMTKSARIDLSGDAGQNFIASYLALYENGSLETGRINIFSGRGSGFVVNSAGKKLQKLVIVGTKATKISAFGDNEPTSTLNVKVSMMDTDDAQAGLLKDGALIKRPREKEIYVIWGKYKRYLNSETISLYGHLNPANAIELDPATFDSYQTSNYVKYVNDEKVYAIWPDGTKHWLNITAKQWDDSRRDWNAIFTINELEVNHYRPGPDITK